MTKTKIHLPTNPSDWGIAEKENQALKYMLEHAATEGHEIEVEGVKFHVSIEPYSELERKLREQGELIHSLTTGLEKVDNLMNEMRATCEQFMRDKR